MFALNLIARAVIVHDGKFLVTVLDDGKRAPFMTLLGGHMKVGEPMIDSVVREVRGKGMFRGVELMRNNGATGEPFPELGTALKETALRNGLIMRIDPTWFAVAPALIADKAAIDELFDLIERSLLEALEQVDGQA